MVKVEIIIPEANIFHLCIFETQLFLLHQVLLLNFPAAPDNYNFKSARVAGRTGKSGK